jgi:hypothetical protein
MKHIIFVLLIIFISACTKLPICNINKSYLKKNIDFSKNKINIKGSYCICQITDTISKGETGIVCGHIYSKLTGEKLNGVVNVVGASNTIGLNVKENGYFMLELPKGEYILDVIDGGFMNVKTKKFMLNKNVKLNLTFI